MVCGTSPHLTKGKIWTCKHILALHSSHLTNRNVQGYRLSIAIWSVIQKLFQQGILADLHRFPIQSSPRMCA